MPQALPEGIPLETWIQRTDMLNNASTLSSHALSAIASWSNVEHQMLRLFVSLMGGRESAAAAVYSNLSSQSTKSAAVSVAAEIWLVDRPDELKYLRAILKWARAQEKFRNKLAHWVWAQAKELPDALVLIDPREGQGLLMKDAALVFRVNDFIGFVDENIRLSRCCIDLAHAASTTTENRNRRETWSRLTDSADLPKWM